MRATHIKTAFSLLMLAVAFVLPGCDSFKLLEMFESDKSAGALSLIAQKTVVNQDESVTLYPSGGTAPYTFAVIAEDLYYSAGNDFGYVTGQVFTAQKAVGKVKIRVSDQAGANGDLVVTVRPLAPTGFAAASATSGNNSIDLSWSYADTAYISGYRIQSSVDNANAFTDIAATLAPSDASYIHSTLNQTKTYYYRMYAVAGNYESAATSIQSAKPN